MKKKITIGTRGSKLALIYAKIAEKNINKFKSRFSIKSVSIKKVITAATGFPGKPINGVLLNFPKAKGLPGFKASCQKFTLPEIEKKLPI